jgi:rubrerythrin
METSSTPEIQKALAVVVRAELSAIARYRTVIKALPNESSRRLFLSVIDQKQKHRDRLAEIMETGTDTTTPAPEGELKDAFYATEITQANLLDFLKLCVGNETMMKTEYERIASILQVPDERFLVEGFVADEKKMVTWLTDFHDLLAMTSDLKQA